MTALVLPGLLLMLMLALQHVEQLLEGAGHPQALNPEPTSPPAPPELLGEL